MSGDSSPLRIWEVFPNDKPRQKLAYSEADPAATYVGLRELGRYWIEWHGEGRPRLVVDDEELALDASTADVGWYWSAAFYAGSVEAQLLGAAGERIAQFRLDISPNPRKLGAQQYEQMIARLLEADASMVVGSEAATVAVGTTGYFSHTHLEFWRLRRLRSLFMRSLRAVAAEPMQRPTGVRQQAPLQTVKRIDAVTVSTLARNPLLLAELLGGTTSAVTRTLDVPAWTPSTDMPANRTIAWIAQRVASRVVHVRTQLADQVASEGETGIRSSLASRWLVRKRELDQFEVELRTMLRRRPFKDLSRIEVSAGGLTQVAAHPIYARTFRVGNQILRRGSDGAQTEDRVWLPPTFDVYERWCFVELADQLRSRLPAWTWKRATKSAFCSTVDRVLVGTLGERRIELLFQPVATTGAPSAKRLGSITGERRPDLVIVHARDTETTFVVLDAKYRSGRNNVLEAMTSAHIYHDALRLQGQRPLLSLLLVPQHYDVDWLAHPDFVLEHGVGIARFSNEEAIVGPKVLTGCLQRLGVSEFVDWPSASSTFAS